MKHLRIAINHLRNESGQEMVELGIVIVLFIALVGGVMQFGHAFMIANMVTHAARDGARVAASWTKRDTCGQITDYTAIKNAVKNTIGEVTNSGVFTVAVSQIPAPVNGAVPPNCPAIPAGTVPQVKVNVTGCVPYVFNIPGLHFGANCNNGFAVNRDVTFSDELRATFGS